MCKHSRLMKVGLSFWSAAVVALTFFLLGAPPPVYAHNLQTQMVYMFFDEDTQTLLDNRIAGGWVPGTPLLQVNDELGIITKVIGRDNETFTGVGGHVDFYIPNGVQVVDVGYMIPDGSGGFVKAGMKGQSPIAIGDGPVGTNCTPTLSGLTLGPNYNGVTAKAVADTTGCHNGTIAGVYGDTGIFYSTSPETAWGSYGSTLTLTNNSGDEIVPLNRWDAEQLAAYGIKASNNPAYPGVPIVDPNGRGNAPWGNASGVAGPESGYAWQFDMNVCGSPGNPCNATTIKDASNDVGPWNRIKYPGSRISFDQPGLKSTTIGYANIDASNIGVAANTLPSTTSQTDATSPKTIRWAVGQLTRSRPEYVWVKVKIENPGPGFLDPQGCPFFYSGTFGGDAGGTDNGKDHLWRYYEPSTFVWNGCYAAGKPSTDEFVKTGDTLQYKIKAYNLGTQTLTNVVVKDTLPTGLTFISAAPAQNSGPNPLVWNLGTWQPGEKFEAILTVKVTGSTTLNNCLVISSNERPPQNTCDATPPNVPYLVQTKDVTPTTITPGAPVTYTLTVENIGTAVTGSPVTVTDYLPTGFTYQSLGTVTANGAVVTATVNSSNPSQPTFTVPAAIQAGKKLVITFTAATSPSLAAGSYCNTYSVTQNGVPITTGSEGCVTVGGGQIGDTIFRDWNGNGVQDAGEEGMPGVTVTLSGTSSASATTDANGNYLFSGLNPGSYTVTVPNPGAGGVPTGYTLTADPNGAPIAATFTLTLAQDQKRLDVDFGYKPGGAGSIGDQVFEDKNANGVFDGTDVGISSVTVNLYEDTNGNGTIDTGDNQIATTTTNASGIYSFTNLDPARSYLVQAVDGTGSAVDTYFTNPYQRTTGSNPVKVTPAMFTAQSNTVTTADFGYYGQTPGSIGDQVFIDSNGDGVYTTGEPGIGGVTVYLYIDADNDGQPDSSELFKTTTTNANGIYGFPNLGPDKYIVVVDPNDPAIPAGYFSNVTNIPVTLTAGQNVTTADFPFRTVLTKTVDKATASNGETLNYTIKPTYPGGELLDTVRVIDPLPVGTTFGTANAGGTFGAYSPIPAVPGNDAGPPALDTAVSVSSNIVTVGASITVTLNVKSSVAVNNVSPTDLEVSGGNATCTGPSPATQNVPAGGAGVNFTWTCTLSSVAEYIFTAGAEDATATTSWPDASSSSVLATLGGSTSVVTWNLGSNEAGVPGVDSSGGVTAGIYAFQGASQPAFSRYGPTSNSWTARAGYGANVAKGGAVVYVNVGGTDYIYGLQGGGTKVFKRYDVSSNSWTSRANTSDNVGEGGALVYLDVGGTQYIYALLGNSNKFRRYSISGNSWSNMANTPASVKKGGALTTDGTYIYALQGDRKNGFWRYDPATDTWTARANVPANVGWGGSLTRIGNYIYALRGDGQKNFYRYDIAANTWSSMTATPGNVADGGALTTDGTNIYAFQGKTTGFWRYNVASNNWTILANYLATTNQGGALTYLPGSGTVDRTNKLAAAPTLVGGGDSFKLTMTLTSNAAVNNVTPGTLTPTTTGGASASCTLQAPISQNIPANGSIIFTWNCTATAGTNPGSVKFSATASGTSPATTWASATSNSVLVTPLLTFSATNIAFPTACVIENTAMLSDHSGNLGTTPGNTTQTSGNVGSCGTNGASIGDRVWNDINGDGVQDSGEGGIAGVKVYIDSNTNGQYDPGEPTTTTDVTGLYHFYGLAAGTYTVRTVASTYPVGYIPTTPTFVTNTVAANTAVNTFDFGLQSKPFDPASVSSIGDYVWLDADKDGLQDPGEQPLPGITIKLYRDVNNSGGLDASDPLIDTQVTDPNGLYGFTNLPAGTYLVQVDTTSKVTSPYTGATQYNLGDVMSPTTNTVNPKLVSLAFGDNVTDADFGYNWSGVVGDTVFYDNGAGGGTAQDGIQNGGEAGASGVTLVIVWDQNGNGVVDNLEPAVKSTTTNGSGIYTFADLPPGKYVVQAAGQTVASPTNPNLFGTMVPTASYGENYAVSLTPGQMSNLNADFGYVEAARVSGTVFHDVNHSSVLDSGEPGLSGITVCLDTNNNGSCNAGEPTTTTDANGDYKFIVAPGNYTVIYNTAQTTALGYPEATTPTSISFTALAGGEYSGLNFGVDNSGSIGDRVWNDANGNGVQDSGEPGIAGVTLNLYLDTDGNETTTGDQTLVATTATDGLGNYTFPGLPNTTGSQKYVVKVNTATVPSGYTEKGEGQPGSLCSGLPNGCDNQIATTLTGGAAITNVDFGYQPPAGTYSVSGKVWNDQDGNGAINGAETGIPNAQVCLYQSDGVTVVACTTSAANGDYTFPGLSNGTYVVKVNPATLPNASYVQTGDPDGVKDNKTTVTVNNANVTDKNFGYQQQLGSIAGTVCFGNGDGQCGTGEIAIPSVTVTLKYAGPDGIFGTTDDTTQTTTTNPSGAYSFTNLVAGNYQVVETNPTGITSLADADGGNPDNIAVTLSPNQNVTKRDFEDKANSIGDYVWFDTNQDGIQDAEEKGIAGVTVTLYDAAGSILLATTQTDGSGFYTFGNLLGGNYTVIFTAPSGYTFTSNDKTDNLPTLADSFDSDADPTTGAAQVVGLTGDNPTIDAGLYLTNNDKPARIGDRVWYDTNNNGIQDSGEPGLAGVSVELWNPAHTTLLATTVSDGNGNYEFAGLPAGNYVVEFIAPTGYTRSPKDVGGNDNIDSDANSGTGRTDPITLAAGQNLSNVDSGMYVQGQAPSSIGDRVWYDTNDNGIQDSGEPGMPGVVVKLYDTSGSSTPIATTQTDASGLYTFNGLKAGSYIVEFVAPVGYDISFADQGSNDALDSDANPTTGRTPTIVLGPGQTMSDVDAGMLILNATPFSIGDFIWVDLNGNTSPDNGEGLAGVQVVLYDALGNELTRVTTNATDTNYLFTGVGPGDYRVAIDPTTLPPWVQIADPDTNLDNQTELVNEELDNFEVDFGYQPNMDDLDFGDLPDPTYPTLLISNGARHLPTGVLLGARRDVELNGQPDVNATGDDLTNQDEDGVLFTAALSPNNPAVSLTVTSTGPGVLNAWVDFNADGDFADQGEQIFVNQPLLAGPNPLSFATPAYNANDGNKRYARFRVTALPGQGGDSPIGLAPNGEVEDYDYPTSPTAVELVYFKSLVTREGSQDVFYVEWKTANEIDTVGFEVYRWDNRSLSYRFVGQVIPATGPGSVYRLKDGSGVSPWRNTYLLRELTSRGYDDQVFKNIPVERTRR